MEKEDKIRQILLEIEILELSEEYSYEQLYIKLIEKLHNLINLGGEKYD